MSQTRYRFGYVVGVAAALAVAVAFALKVGVDIAATTWVVATCPQTAACLLVAALPGLRQRIRIVPVLLATLTTSSLAGWLVIAAYSLDVAEMGQQAGEVGHHLPSKFSPPTPAAASLYWSATAAGALTGGLFAGSASWFCTRSGQQHTDLG